jgi:hypothetical protein
MQPFADIRASRNRPGHLPITSQPLSDQPSPTALAHVGNSNSAKVASAGACDHNLDMVHAA